MFAGILCLVLPVDWLCGDVFVVSQQKQNICITFMRRRPNVFDVGPTLYKWYTNILCLLGFSVLYFQWIGNVVTCSWWENIWLQETMARYYQHRALKVVELDWDIVSNNFWNQRVTSDTCTWWTSRYDLMIPHRRLCLRIWQNYTKYY